MYPIVTVAMLTASGIVQALSGLGAKTFQPHAWGLRPRPGSGAKTWLRGRLRHGTLPLTRASRGGELRASVVQPYLHDPWIAPESTVCLVSDNLPDSTRKESAH